MVLLIPKANTSSRKLGIREKTPKERNEIPSLEYQGLWQAGKEETNKVLYQRGGLWCHWIAGDYKEWFHIRRTLIIG
jgi:hypothetical protein